jgi:hypothetical protein
MGHTVWSQRIAIDIILQELAGFSRALRKEDCLALNEILKKPLKHIGSISYADSYHVWAFILLAILVEQEKKIKKLEGGNVADRRLQEQEQYNTLD